MTATRIVVAVALAIAARLPAQQPTRDNLLDHMIGRWVLRGTIARDSVVHDITARWVLLDEYVEMREVSRERTPDGTPLYEAIVYIGRDPKTREYAALWLDNTAYGGFDPAGTGRGMAAGDSIPFLFKSPTDSVHTTFVYDRVHDTWAWHMDNDDARGRRPFARVTLAREPATSASSPLPADLAAAVQAFDQATARNDTATLARLVADDYVLVNSDASVENKAQYLADFMLPGFRIDPYTIEQPVLKLSDGSALVSGVVHLGWTQDGRHQTRTIRIAHTWALRDGRWRLVYTQVTRVPG